MVPFLLVFHMRSVRIDLNLNIGYHPGVPFFHHEISRYFVSNHCQNLCGGSLKRCYFPDLTPFIFFTAVGCIDGLVYQDAHLTKMLNINFFGKKYFVSNKFVYLCWWFEVIWSSLCDFPRNQIKPNQTHSWDKQTHATQIAASDSLSLNSEVPNERADWNFYWKFSKDFGIIREASKC